MFSFSRAAKGSPLKYLSEYSSRVAICHINIRWLSLELSPILIRERERESRALTNSVYFQAIISCNITAVCTSSRYLPALSRPCLATWSLVMQSKQEENQPKLFWIEWISWDRNIFPLPCPLCMHWCIWGIYIEMFRNGNPYHNNLHASDVLQTTHWFISQAGLKVIQSSILALAAAKSDLCYSSVLAVWPGDIQYSPLRHHPRLRSFRHNQQLPHPVRLRTNHPL